MTSLQKNNSNHKGKLIIVEGIDRSGKSTLVKNLAIELSKLKFNIKPLNITKMSFPNRTSPTGIVIDKYLKSSISLNPQTIHLLFSANRWEQTEEIKNILNDENSIIVCDRYWYSGAAYTTAKGVDFEWAKSADKGLPVPDLVIFVDLKPEIAAKRSGFGEEKYEKIEYQKECYKWLLKLVSEDKNGIVVDGELNEKELTNLVMKKVIKILN